MSEMTRTEAVDIWNKHYSGGKPYTGMVDAIEEAHALGAQQAQERIDALEARLAEQVDVMKEVGLFLHHCWCDVSMNDYSFKRLNQSQEALDAAIKKGTP